MVAAELDEGNCTMQGWSFCLPGQSAGDTRAVAVGSGSRVEPEMVAAIVIAGTETVAVLAVGIGYVHFGNFRRDWNNLIVLGIALEVAIAGPVRAG